MEGEDIKRVVREGYGAIARKDSLCCGPAEPCCGGNLAEGISEKIGYSREELQKVPRGANLGLGCGNPVALASLREGETVLDLGCGPGLDCFLAAERVGRQGKVIGVDMTPEMLDRARDNAREGGYGNVEFRLGEIENLPLADASVDVIISNCVINLSSDKPRVFREAFRVLKPGGRLLVSDIVLEEELPRVVRESTSAYLGCIAGAALRRDYVRMIEEAGFVEVEVVQEGHFPLDCMSNDPSAQALVATLNLPVERLEEMLQAVTSAAVRAVKPA